MTGTASRERGAATLSAPEFASRLEPWLAERLGHGLRIADLHRHTEGFSWITFTFAARWSEGSHRQRCDLVVRCEPEDGVLPPYDASVEHANHAAIEAVVAAPMPKVRWLETDASVLGAPFYVMERVEGRVPGPDDRDPFPEGVRPVLAEQFVSALAAIHAVPADALPTLRGTPPSTAGDACHAAVEFWGRCYHDAVLEDIPVVRAALTLLASSDMRSAGDVLCHGDYRLGNIIVDDDRLAAVLDWELVHIGDPVEDLTWAAMRAFRGQSGLVAQLLSEDDFFARYSQLSGRTVSLEERRFWSVLNHVKAIAIYLRGCRAFEERRTNDLRLAAMGHRCRYLVEELVRELESAGWAL